MLKINFYMFVIILIFSTVSFAQDDVNKPEQKDVNTVSENSIQEKPKEETNVKPELGAVVVKSSRIKRKKPAQDISHYSMTNKEIKETPASFGDSIAALTSMPGIIKTSGGLFGPLVIRGADPSANNYYADDIPIHNPMHFGGLHSVFNTNLISSIDVYASAFPAEFGNANAGVIEFTTLDEVDDPGMYADISLLSAGVMLQSPILFNTNGEYINPLSSKENGDLQNKGYVIASARYGYLALAIKLTEYITGDEIPISPEYWDYQYKMKYELTPDDSLTLFLFGHKDFIRVLLDDRLLEEGDDPLFMNSKMRFNIISHSQGLWYDFEPRREFKNKLLFFSSLPETYFYANIGGDQQTVEWARNIHLSSKPYTFGLKDKIKIKYLDDKCELLAGAGYTLYYFSANGKMPTMIQVTHTQYDYASKYIDLNLKNHLFSGYAQNKFEYRGFTLMPGIRSDYLNRAQTATFDPRIMTSYKFPSKTTLSAAGGKYTYFLQVNPFLFDNYPEVCALGKILKPEKAVHSTLAAEQEIGLLTLKVEGFKNYFYDLGQAYEHTEPDGTKLPGLSCGKLKTHGAEIMLRKDLRENQNGYFGWCSYTYTKSKFKSGLPLAADDYGDKWINSYYEQRHSLKFVGGYIYNRHSISGKFQFYSSFPYSPYKSYYYDSVYYSDTGKDRYAPLEGNRNSAHYPAYHQLDIRYTYKKQKNDKQYWSLYFEIINIYNKKDVEQKWDYRYPYQEGSNPRIVEQDGLAMLLNIGAELKL